MFNCSPAEWEKKSQWNLEHSNLKHRKYSKNYQKKKNTCDPTRPFCFSTKASFWGRWASSNIWEMAKVLLPDQLKNHTPSARRIFDEDDLQFEHVVFFLPWIGWISANDDVAVPLHAAWRVAGFSIRQFTKIQRWFRTCCGFTDKVPAWQVDNNKSSLAPVAPINYTSQFIKSSDHYWRINHNSPPPSVWFRDTFQKSKNDHLLLEWVFSTSIPGSQVAFIRVDNW